MPKRQNVKKHPCDEIQGEDSFVRTVEVKVKEIREIRKRTLDPEFDEFEGGISLLAKHILEWNFVDDEGEPLPQPKEQPEVIDELTNQETIFLVNLLIGEAKN